jgi:hypothetical protein
VELAQTVVTLQGRPRELLPGSTSLWKSPHVNPWDAMFGIFPRWCITHHDSMHCFSIFLIFSEFPRPILCKSVWLGMTNNVVEGSFHFLCTKNSFFIF